MGVKVFRASFKNLSIINQARLDAKFNYFVNCHNYSVWANKSMISLKYVMTDILSPTIKKGELDEEYFLIDLENVERKTNTLLNLIKVSEIGSDKNLISKGDIVIPKLEPKKGQFFLNNEHKDYITSTEFVEYIIDKSVVLPEFIYYLLVNDKFLEALACLESGKTHKRVAPKELLKIKIPIISIEKQKTIVNKIIPIDKKIKELNKKIESDRIIINRVFAKEFNWDIEKFEELKQVRIMKNSFALFGNNIDIRFSNKFHNKAGEYVTNVLRGQTTKCIKDYLAEDITLGKGISPSDFDENGEYYYVSMADIKNWHFESEEAKTITKKFYDDNPNKRIALGDIIIARSGEGTIGKVALIEDEEKEGIYADFTMRIRLKDYNNLFAYYYFRTDYFQHLIYTHKKGLGNNTNIFPSQIKEFPIPDISIKEQDKIAQEIKSEIDAQRKIDKQIEEKQKEISRIIEEAIRIKDDKKFIE